MLWGVDFCQKKGTNLNNLSHPIVGHFHLERKEFKHTSTPKNTIVKFSHAQRSTSSTYQQEHTPPNFIHQSRSPTIHITKKINTFFPKNISKISKINSRINFIQKYPRNYCSISSQIAYKFLLCFFVKMCFAKLHFLTVHLQTSHSISI